jgi:shikimate kinase/3-dehydroquinate synthase
MRPLVLVGFMGAGKTTVGRLLAARLDTAFADADDVVCADAGMDVPAIFAAEGEAGFRERERAAIAGLVEEARHGVIALGGGALREPTATLLRDRATVVWLDVDADTAWGRVRGDDRRPLARDEARFRALQAERTAAYAAAADRYVDASAAPDAVAGAILGSPLVRSGASRDLARLVGDRNAVTVVDEAVAHIVEPVGTVVTVRGGEDAKSVAGIERLWRALADARLERRDVVVAIGGGTVTDVAGFAAASFRRGIGWIAVPTTIVGQVDAAIGGKTGINVAAKNDVGAFHLPEAVVCDPDLLATLPARERAAGLAEAVKTALLSGWTGVEDADPIDLVRRTSAYKVRVVTEDPTERGIRAYLNLGHTIGHGIEAAAGYGGLLHGEAVSVGLVAALWLSERVRGLDASVLVETEALLRRLGLPVRAPGIDVDRVLALVESDKKRVAGRTRFVLLDAVGSPVHGIEVDPALVRAAVERVA